MGVGEARQGGVTMSELPALEGVVFESSGCKLLGALYRAGGTEPCPMAVLLHGIPGLEKNSDLAHVLQDAGWNALIFHYRGCWGSEGDYTLVGISEDVHQAINCLLSGAYPVDPSRIVLIGHGLGGWAALVTASRDQRVRAIVSIGGIANTRTASMVEDEADVSARFLHGVTARGLQSQWRALGAMYNPVDLVTDIIPRPILIVHGAADTTVPVSQAMEFKQSAGDNADLLLIEGADHSFIGQRRRLVETVVWWLEKKLG